MISTQQFRRFRRSSGHGGQGDADTVGTVQRVAERSAAEVQEAVAVRAGEQRGLRERRRLLFAEERLDGQQAAARPVARQQLE